jgi:hypothetical protein
MESCCLSCVGSCERCTKLEERARGLCLVAVTPSPSDYQEPDNSGSSRKARSVDVPNSDHTNIYRTTRPFFTHPQQSAISPLRLDIQFKFRPHSHPTPPIPAPLPCTQSKSPPRALPRRSRNRRGPPTATRSCTSILGAGSRSRASRTGGVFD